jgi:Flp pilus assembly protein TadB
MHKVCGIFSVILAVVFATVTLGVMPAAAAAKSDDQKRIEREHETKRQADRQKEIDKTNRELDRNRQWRQQHGNDANINQNKLNDRTRDLNA